MLIMEKIKMNKIFSRNKSILMLYTKEKLQGKKDKRKRYNTGNDNEKTKLKLCCS